MERTDSPDIRHRPADLDCAECLKIAAGLVEAVILWEKPTSTPARFVSCAINLRVSCKETLAGQRLCPFVGQQRNDGCVALEIDYGERGIEDLVRKHSGGVV